MSVFFNSTPTLICADFITSMLERNILYFKVLICFNTSNYPTFPQGSLLSCVAQYTKKENVQLCLSVENNKFNNLHNKSLLHFINSLVAQELQDCSRQLSHTSKIMIKNVYFNTETLCMASNKDGYSKYKIILRC